MSKFGQALTNGLDSSRTVIHLKTRRPGRSKEYPGRSTSNIIYSAVASRTQALLEVAAKTASGVLGAARLRIAVGSS